MRHASLARAVGELRQIRTPASGPHRVRQHAPAACDGLEVRATRGRAARAPPRGVVVLQGRGALVRAVAPAPIDAPHHLWAGGAEGGHPWVEIRPPLLGLTVRAPCREDVGGAVLDGAQPPARPAARDPAPGARAPRRACEGGVALARARAQRTAPPAHPGAGTAPPHGCSFLAHHARPPARPIRQGSAGAGARGAGGWRGGEPPGGAAGASAVPPAVAPPCVSKEAPNEPDAPAGAPEALTGGGAPGACWPGGGA